jgi:hypothetical protein
MNHNHSATLGLVVEFHYKVEMTRKNDLFPDAQAQYLYIVLFCDR